MEQVRDYIEPLRPLSSNETRVWQLLNEQWAPFVASDSLGLDASRPLASLSDYSWWSLYATALLCLSPASLAPAPIEPIDKPHYPGFATLVDDFWAQRHLRLRRFRRFLDEWHLSARFAANADSHRAASATATATPPGDGDCVLWFHLFTTFSEVQKYALRWTANSRIISAQLSAHRLVTSRAIDLICSELLANAFEHSAGAPFFILAKLCSPQSAALSIALNARHPFLTPTERAMYELCLRHNCPVLQLAIADSGVGFAGNSALRTHYETSSGNGSLSTATEADLIFHALLPEVSTKNPAQLSQAWRTASLDPATDYAPVIHGLSEVRLFIHEYSGHWRIHSGATAVDVDGSAQTLEPFPARPIPGCLHYIQLPLLPEAAAPPRLSLSLSPRSPIRALQPLDIADHLHQPHGSTGVLSFATRIESFCRSVLDSSAADAALVVTLLALDDSITLAGDHDRVHACALIADAMHRVRSRVGVFLIASEYTRSLLRRFKGSQPYFDRRVLAYMGLFSTSANIAIDCGDSLTAVTPLLEAALHPWTEHAVLRSGHADVWPVLQQVQIHNSGLFELVALPGGDFAFEGRLKATLDAPRGQLLLGTRSFASVGGHLRAREGLLPWDEHQPYWFRGTQRNTHLNMGRLVADEAFRSDLIVWFAVAARSLAYDASVAPHSLVFVALLHPAIGVTQELLRTRFPEAELVEIGSLAEVSADSWQFLNLVNRDVICVADMIVSGATLTQLVDAVGYAGGRVLGALSILAQPNSSVPTRVFAFSQYTEDALKDWAPSLRRPAESLSTREQRIVDANSQFTGSVSGRLTPLERRVHGLLSSDSLLFAHRVFGRNHHIFPILVRTLLERNVIADVLQDLRSCIRDYFASKPFVILYPSESTVSYLLRHDEELLPPDKSLALVPSFSGYGQRRLTLDRSSRSVNRSLASANVLFIDDSLSSGHTERLAREAWDREPHTPTKKWLTYVVVKRGAYVGADAGDAPHTAASPATAHRASYQSKHYCAVGPKSFAPGDCPFCVGLDRLKAAHRLAEPLDNTAASVLRALVQSFRATPVEGHGATSLLSPADAADFLTLATNPMWESAFAISRDSSSVSAGRALYLAFFAGDLSAYLSPGTIAAVLARFANDVEADDRTATQQLLAALSVLPAGYVHAATTSAMDRLLRNSHTTAALAACALALAQSDSLLSQFAVAGMSLPERAARGRRLLASIDDTLHAAARDVPQIQAAARVMQLEVQAMASPAGTSGIVQLARTLSALFYDGAHVTLLVPQLDSLNETTLDRVRHQLLNAFVHLERFAAISDVFTPRVLADCRARLEDAAEARDCTRFVTEARFIVAQWSRLRSQYFHTAHQLREEAVQGLTAALRPYNGIAGSYDWFGVDELPGHVRGWHVLGPDARHLRDHFTNLFTNTLKHAPETFHPPAVAKMASGREAPCVARVSWRVDDAHRELVVSYAQSIPFKRHTPAGRGLMANTNALMTAFGGRVELSDHGPGEEPRESLGPFIEVCVTRMQLVLEVPRERAASSDLER
jgi:hypothetical protein